MTTLAPLKKGDWDLECGSLPLNVKKLFAYTASLYSMRNAPKKQTLGLKIC
jgi:hypothetical protein